ncbi:MAG: hypothetical protein CW346_10080 [Bacillaceae bacterium]|nr:hypothetical protein [Bacillaceae bacterium]
MAGMPAGFAAETEKFLKNALGRHRVMNAGPSFKSPSPLKFIILVFALSIPFRLIGAGAEHPADRLPVQLPVSSLMAVCPMGAALILVYREEKYAGIKSKKKSTYSALLLLEGAAVSERVCVHPVADAGGHVPVLRRYAPYGKCASRMANSAFYDTGVFFIAAIGKEAG